MCDNNDKVYTMDVTVRYNVVVEAQNEDEAINIALGREIPKHYDSKSVETLLIEDMWGNECEY